MTLLGATVAILILIGVLGLPGYLVSRALRPEACGDERMALTLICSFSVVPLPWFLLSVGAGVPIERPLLVILALVTMAGAIATTRRDRTARYGRDLSPRHWLGLGLAVTFASLLIATGLRALDGGDVFATLQHCLYVIVMHGVTNHPSEALPLYDHLSGDTMHVLVHHTTRDFGGLAPLFHEQRLGNAAIMAPHIALVGSAGWYTVCIHAVLVTLGCTWAAARRVGAAPWAAALGAGLLILGLQTICAYTVNENMFAVALVAFLLWATLDDAPSLPLVVVIGLVSGHLVGVRHTSALFWPAVAVALWWSTGDRPARLKRAGVAALAAALTVAPWLYVNAIMLGNPLSHPKVIDDSDGRVVQNSLFGLQFTFKALNWPFTDQVVRTAWNPFPTFLWLPLLAMRAFGQLASAIALFGVAGQRRTAVILLLFALPHSAAMAWLELLDWEQISYATPGLVPFGVWFAIGATRLSRPAHRVRNLAIAASLLVLLVGLSFGVRSLSFPVDVRGLDPADWEHAPEPDLGTNAVRTQLTGFHPLPRPPVFRSVVAAQFGGALRALVTGGSAPLADVPRTAEGGPIYPSGQVGLLTGYAETEPRHYRFDVAGGPLRTSEVPLRTGVSLHAVSLRLPAERISVDVTRDKGRYLVNVVPNGDGELQDFTFFISPWRPFLRELVVTLDGAALPGLRVLNYAGRIDDGEAVYLATNYPDTDLDLRTLHVTIDPAGETVHCGWIIFGTGHDFTRIETLVLGGGHVQSWDGSTTLELRLPHHVLADQLLVFSEPYCSSHVPQYGDRYGLVPIDENTDRVIIRLDQLWTEAASF